jgi:thiamine kinase-like enzyme
LGLAPILGGLTNRSFSFRLDGRAYVLRLPGPGAALVDRQAERAAYRALSGAGLADELVAMDQAGARVTVFYDGARVARPDDDSDLAIALGLARRLHQMRWPAGRSFDLAGQIRRYERLCGELGGAPYPDLERQRARTAELLELLGAIAAEAVFCHGDLNPDNVLILADGQAKLIDWEYAGRADPLLDVAMYCLCSFFQRDRANLALRLYLGGEPTARQTARFHLHLALGGYLCALWTHCAGQTGQTGQTGQSGSRFYAYALEYYRLAQKWADRDLTAARPSR